VEPGGTRVGRARLRQCGRPARWLHDAGQLVLHRLPAPAGPQLLPSARTLPPGTIETPHGTTIVSATFAGGVVMAGDRRATMGNVIRPAPDIEKVFRLTSSPASASPARPASRSSSSGCSGRARALREDRGRPAVPGRQGQSPRHVDPRQPRQCHAGPGRRPVVRRLRPRDRARRIFSYDVTAAATRSTRSTRSAPLDVRSRLAQEAVRPGAVRG